MLETYASQAPRTEGGAVMNALTRQYNHSASELGPLDQWPLSLRVTLGMVLQANLPMCLWWGDEQVPFYNEAYRPFAEGAGEQLRALGEGDAGDWPELQPLLQQVVSTGTAQRFLNRRIPVLKTNTLVDAYWNLNYSPVPGESGAPAGVLLIVTEGAAPERIDGFGPIDQSASLRQLVEEAPVATSLFVGRDMRVAMANKTMLGYWGKDASVIGLPLIDAVPELKGQPFLALLEQVFDTGKTHEEKAARADLEKVGQRQTYYFDYTYKPLFDADGKVYAIMDVAVDVTEAVNAKQALDASEAYFRRLTDTVPAIIWTTRPDGYCTYLNKQWYDFTGQTVAEAEGFGWLDATHPDDKELAGQLFIEANNRQGSFSALYRLRHKDGQYRWAIDLGSPRFDANGVYEGIVGTVVDVHDQKIAEEEKLKLVSIVEASQEFIGLAAPDTSLEYLNPAALRLLGWENVADKTLLDCFEEKDRPQARCMLDELLASGHSSQAMRLTNARTGQPFWLQWSAVTIPDALTGETVGIAMVSLDITERRKSEQALKESEERFQAAVTAVEGILWTNNADGQMEGLQAGWSQLTGQSQAEYQGYGWSTAVHPDDAQPTIDAWEQAVRERQPFLFEHRVRKRDGNWGLFSIQAVPLLNADGEVREWVGVHTDITEQRQAARILAESEGRFRNMVEQAPVAMFVFRGEDLIIETVNQPALDIINRTRSIVGKPLLVSMPEIEGQPILDRVREVMQTGIAYFNWEEEVIIFRNGRHETGFYDVSYTPLYEGSRLTGIMHVATEVTQKVLARRAVEAAQTDLMEANQRLSMALNAGSLGSYELELESGKIQCTTQCKAMLGLAPSDALDYPKLMALVFSDDREKIERAIANTLETQQTLQVEYRVQWPDGSLHWIKASGQLVSITDAQPTKLIGITQDITAQRMAQEELERQVQQRTQQLQASVRDLERSNANLEQFAYVASHDLQEPLRKIKSFGDLLQTNYAAELGEGAAHLKRMQTAAGRMSTLIRDLLAYSRISTQQAAAERVSLPEVVSNALADLDLLITETGAEVTVEPLPTIQGDSSQLGQLMQNLLNNALKFRREGIAPRIQIRVDSVMASALPSTIKPTRPARTYYRIDVVDNGIGFDSKYIDRIFNVFQRLNSHVQYPGTGIGLAICEKVAANHGGGITAGGKPGEGATFSVYLPK